MPAAPNCHRLQPCFMICTELQRRAAVRCRAAAPDVARPEEEFYRAAASEIHVAPQDRNIDVARAALRGPFYDESGLTSRYPATNAPTIT